MDTSFDQIIDRIESSYEFMLAYAAQGRDFENTGGDGPSIRQFLTELEQGLGAIGAAAAERIDSVDPSSSSRAALDNVKVLMTEDAAKARMAVQLVLAVPSISSQLVDNLNASTHLRCLLTDMFLLDEALKVIARA